jgi:hypothetical protein
VRAARLARAPPASRAHRAHRTRRPLQVVNHIDCMEDALKHVYTDTDGDNNPFHVTNCLTTRADGELCIPPFLSHSSPSTKTGTPKLSRKYLDGICERDSEGERTNPTGIGVFVTKSGSMTKDRFPAFCRHFVENLPDGQGKGGDPVVLVFDGHASRWSYTGISYLLEHNVFCLCLPGHASIWAQPNDCGPNASFTSVLGSEITAFRSTHLSMPGAEAANKMTRVDFNGIFSRAWRAWSAAQHQERLVGGNSIMSAWAGTGLEPYNRRPPKWEAAIAKWGKRVQLGSTSAPEEGEGEGVGVGVGVGEGVGEGEGESEAPPVVRPAPASLEAAFARAKARRTAAAPAPAP